MPSPVGHMLAGVAVTWSILPQARTRVATVAAVLAAAPDLDLLLPVQHRTATHSIAAVALVVIVAAAVTREVTPAWRARLAAVCGLAVASHLLLDWLGPDPVFPHGIRMFWPLSDRFFISGWDIFRPTARTAIFSPAVMAHNLAAAAQELLLLGPLVWLLWFVRVKPAARFPAEVPGRHHPPK
ncbi:MAG: metal-dependent hydrolase [Acidobacteria bacterium]|nr:metal-dependent hydrolase [Acidobacteriota bacterium]